jgi:peptidoglycan-N-acetylmuramic acid deacetylase
MPADIYLTPDDRTLLVGLTGDRVVEVYDVSGRRRSWSSASPTGEGAHAFRSMGDRRHVFVSNRVANTISQIDTHHAHRGGRTARPRRPRLHGPDWPTARRCWWLALGAQAELHRHRQPQGGAAGRGRPLAARRVDAGPCAAALSPRCCVALLHWPRRQRPPCDKPVYLSFDTGHMGVAPLVAEVLARQQVKATFFLANERTLRRRQQPGRPMGALVEARAAEGHAFGSHTWDHDVWLADRADGRAREADAWARRPVRPRTLDAAGYCAELQRPAQRFEAMTGQRCRRCSAPRAARPRRAAGRGAQAAAGRTWAGRRPASWATNCPATSYPNDRLLEQALRDIRAGDILLAHLGIWSRKTPGRRRCWSR